MFTNNVWIAISSGKDTNIDYYSYFEQSGNHTNRDIHTLLEQHGYDIVENPGSPPWARLGVIVYPASVVLPELAQTVERGATWAASQKYIWLDKNDNAEVFYFYDSKSKANQKLFDEAVNAWSKSTCISFTKMPSGECSKKAC